MPPPPIPSSSSMEDPSTAFSVLSNKSTSTAATASSILPTFKRAISTSYPRQTYYELARALKEAIKVKDRKFHLRTYKQCFLGSDAVGFVQDYLELEDRAEALEVGREMNDRIHCWEHVCGDHSLKDEKLFYRFTDESKQQEGSLAQILKSRKRDAVTSTSNSLIDDSDTENNSEEEENKPGMAEMYNQLLKGMDAALDNNNANNPSPTENTSKEADAATTRISRARKPRSRPNSHSPKRERDREANASRSRERGSRERSSANNNNKSQSPTTTTPREGASSKSPKPSQARVPRRPRAERRARSKSPLNGTTSSNGGGTIQRSNTFHGRGSREARKQLHHHVERPASSSQNKRIHALKKKQGSRSPLRRKGSDMSNAASSVGSSANTEDTEKSSSSAFEFPKPLGVVPLSPLPPRSSSNSPISRPRRARSPNHTSTTPTPTESLLAALSPPPNAKKEEDKGFLQRGHASWGGPDSEEFQTLYHSPSEKEHQQSTMHQSMSAFGGNQSLGASGHGKESGTKKKGPLMMKKSISIDDGMNANKPAIVQKSTSEDSNHKNAAFRRSKTTDAAKPEKSNNATKVIKAMFKRSKTTTEAKPKSGLEMPKGIEKPQKISSRSATTGSLSRSLSSDALAKPQIVQKSRSDAFGRSNTTSGDARVRSSPDTTKSYLGDNNDNDDQPNSLGSMGSIHDDARVMVKRTASSGTHNGISSAAMTKSTSSDSLAKPSRIEKTKSAEGLTKSSSSDNLAKPSRIQKTRSDNSAGGNALFKRSKTTGAEAPAAKFRSSLDKNDPDNGNGKPSRTRKSAESSSSKSKSFDSNNGLDGKGSNHGATKSSKSRSSGEAKPRPNPEKKSGGDSRGNTRSKSMDGPDGGSKSPKTSRSRIAVEAKFRSSLDKKKARSGLDKGSNHSLSSNKRGSNHSLSSLGKGSNHSLASGGSRSGMLAALYAESNNKNDDESIDNKNSAKVDESPDEEEQRISLEEVAFAEKRASFGNESVTSALNSSMLGELSDDDFDSKEFA